MLVTKDLNQAKGSITTLTQNSRTRIFLRSRREHVIMSFKNITVAGAGVLGSQIAYQIALSGFNVTVYNHHIDTAEKRINALKADYQRDLNLTDQ